MGGSLEGSRAGAEVRANDSAGSYRSRSRLRDEHSSMSRPPAATLIIFSRRVAPNLIACPERDSSEPLRPSCPPACCSQRMVLNSSLSRRIFKYPRGALRRSVAPWPHGLCCVWAKREVNIHLLHFFKTIEKMAVAVAVRRENHFASKSRERHVCLGAPNGWSRRQGS